MEEMLDVVQNDHTLLVLRATPKKLHNL